MKNKTYKTDNTSEVDPAFLEKYRRDIFVHSCDNYSLEENKKLKKEVSELKEVEKFFEILNNNDCMIIY